MSLLPIPDIHIALHQCDKVAAQIQVPDLSREILLCQGHSGRSLLTEVASPMRARMGNGDYRNGGNLDSVSSSRYFSSKGQNNNIKTDPHHGKNTEFWHLQWQIYIYNCSIYIESLARKKGSYQQKEKLSKIKIKFYRTPKRTNV